MILLLRHGQTDWNVEPARCQGWADVPLNAVGRAQAQDQGRALRGRGIELIVSSHLARARETAEIVRAELIAEHPADTIDAGADSRGDHASSRGREILPLVIDPRLAETDRGTWETRAFAEIIASEPDAWRHYRERPETFRFPGGESLIEQQRRVLAGLRDVLLDGRPSLLVTHGGCIRLIRCFVEGRSVATFHQDSTDNGGIDDVPVEGLAQRIDAFFLGNA